MKEAKDLLPGLLISIPDKNMNVMDLSLCTIAFSRLKLNIASSKSVMSSPFLSVLMKILNLLIFSLVSFF